VAPLSRVVPTGGLVTSSWGDGVAYCNALGGKLAEPISYVEDSLVHNFCKGSATNAGCWIGLTQSVAETKIKCAAGNLPPSTGDWAFASDCTRPLSVMWGPKDPTLSCAAVGLPYDDYDKNTEVVRALDCKATNLAVLCKTPADPDVDPNDALCSRDKVTDRRYARESCYELLYAWHGVPFDDANQRATYFDGTHQAEQLNVDDINLVRGMLARVLARRAVWLGARYVTLYPKVLLVQNDTIGYLVTGWKWEKANTFITRGDLSAFGAGMKLPPGGVNQCLLLWPNGTLGQRSCTDHAEFFRVWRPAGLGDCADVVKDIDCDCGEVRALTGETGGCVPALPGLRFSAANQARFALECIAAGYVAQASRSAVYWKHLACVSGHRALGADSLADPLRLKDALDYSRRPSLRVEPPGSTEALLQNGVAWLSSDVTLFREYEDVPPFTLYDWILEDHDSKPRGICWVACPCGHSNIDKANICAGKDAFLLSSSERDMLRPPSFLVRARHDLMCELSPARRLPPGVFAAHAIGCIAQLPDSAEKRAMVSDIGAVASLSMSRSGPTDLLQAVLAQTRAAALGGDGAGLSSFGSVPSLSADFWSDSSITEFRSALIGVLEQLRNSALIEPSIGELRPDDYRATQIALVQTLSVKAQRVVTTVRARWASKAADVNETASLAMSSVRELVAALESLTGKDGKGGRLARVSAAAD
jgi:hypothetical protein